MDLQGTLDKMSLPDLLQMLANGEQEGTLILKRNSDERKLHVNNLGQVLVHAGMPEHSILGKRLYEAGIILEQEFLNAMRKQSLKAHPLGEILRSYKSVPGEKIDESIRLLVMDTLVELFGWETGQFKFKEGMEETQPPYTEVVFDASSLIMEAIRQYDELKRIADFDWAPTHVFAPSGEDDSSLKGDELAQRVRSCLDGLRNVEGVAAHCGASMADTVNAFSRLVSAGLARLATPEELYENAEESRGSRQLLRSRWLLREAVRLEPSPKHLRKLAEYSQEDGADEEAAEAFVKLARAVLESDPVGSVQSLELAIEIDEKNCNAHELLCRLYISANNLPGAIKEAESIERLCRDRERALACYQLIAEKKPGDLSVRLPIARLLAVTRKYEESYEECKKLERVLPPFRQAELLPIYETIVRAGGRQEEITTRIRRIRKLAAEAREPKRRHPLLRFAVITFVALFLLFVIYQAVSQLRLSAAKQHAEDLELLGQYRGAASLFHRLADTSPFTPVRQTARKLAEDYEKRAEHDAAELAFTAAVAEAQALAEKGEFAQAKQLIEAFKAAYPGHKVQEVRSVLQNLEDAKAQQLIGTTQALRKQALEFEESGHASKAIEIYDRLADDQELVTFAALATERAQALRVELQKARAEMQAAQQMEKAGNLKDAHAKITYTLTKYPATRNDVPIRLPFLVNSMPTGAEVRVDGKRVGNAPCVVHYLPESPRKVEVALAGFSTATFVLSDPAEWTRVAYLSRQHTWLFRADGPLDTAPRLRGGVLYFGSRDTHIYAISAQNGEQLWKTKAGGLSEVTSSPGVTGTVVIVGTLDGGVFAFDLATGQPKWSFATRGFVRSAPEIDEAAERGCVASADGTVYGFSTSSGTVTWKMPAGSSISADAARKANLAIYVTERGKVLALDVVTGEVAWERETGVGAVGIALADNVAVVASSSGEVRGLDAESGEIIWTKVARGKLNSPPVAVHGQVLVATHLGEVAVFQARTGTEVRRIELPEEASAHLAAQDNLLVAATEGGTVFAIDFAKGEVIWPAQTSEAVSCSPLITASSVFVASRDHNIYAYPRGRK